MYPVNSTENDIYFTSKKRTLLESQGQDYMYNVN